jgi:hypothetical protein
LKIMSYTVLSPAGMSCLAKVWPLRLPMATKHPSICGSKRRTPKSSAGQAQHGGVTGLDLHARGRALALQQRMGARQLPARQLGEQLVFTVEVDPVRRQQRTRRPTGVGGAGLAQRIGLALPHQRVLAHPLYPSVPQAALRNPALHELLALFDAIRGGSPRERALAIKLLDERWTSTSRGAVPCA